MSKDSIKSSGLTEEEIKKLTQKSLSGPTLTTASAQRILESFPGPTVSTASAQRIIDAMSSNPSKSENKNISNLSESQQNLDNIGVNKKTFLSDRLQNTASSIHENRSVCGSNEPIINAKESSAQNTLYGTQCGTMRFSNNTLQDENFSCTVDRISTQNGTPNVNNIPSSNEELHIIQQKTQDVLKIFSDKMLPNQDLTNFSGAASVLNSMEELPAGFSMVENYSRPTKEHSEQSCGSIQSKMSESSQRKTSYNKTPQSTHKPMKYDSKSSSNSLTLIKPMNTNASPNSSVLDKNKYHSEHNTSTQILNNAPQAYDYNLSSSVLSKGSKNKIIENTDVKKSSSEKRAQTEEKNEQFSFQKTPENDVFKKISEIVQSKEMPEQLSKKGELICHLFKQRLLGQLEINGNLDEKTAKNANETAAKFAKWVEDILKEVDARKKSSSKLHQKLATNSDRRIRNAENVEDDEERFVSANSSRESFTNKEDLTTKCNFDENDAEVVKIQEISDIELLEKYGHIIDSNNYELFQFVTPDNKPVEVKHLTAVDSGSKVMIVRKKNSDSQWSSWLVEVGPDVTLDPGSVSQNLEKEEQPKESENKNIQRKRTWNDFTNDEAQWADVKLIKNNTQKYSKKMPILKRQCVITESDLSVEYPTYSPSLLSLGVVNQQATYFDDHIIFPSPPQTEPSAPEEP